MIRLYNGDASVCWVVYIHVSFSIFQQYKYRDLTVREITNVISQYKDLKPVMDAYGKILSPRVSGKVIL